MGLIICTHITSDQLLEGVLYAGGNVSMGYNVYFIINGRTIGHRSQRHTYDVAKIHVFSLP